MAKDYMRREFSQSSREGYLGKTRAHSSQMR